MNRRIIKESLIGAAMGLLLFGGLQFYLEGTESIAVKDIEIISGGTGTSDSLFLSNLDYTGKNIFNVNLAEVGMAFCDNFKTEAVSVHRSPGMKIKVSLEEEIPLFWVQGGRLYAISRKGRIIKPSEVDRGYDLPVMVGMQDIRLTFGEYAEDNRLNYAADFLRFVHDYDTELYNKISTIRVNDRFGVVVSLIPDEVSVIMGFSDYGTRIEKLKSVISYIENNGKNLTEVDLRHGNMILFNYNKKKWGTG
ncbi:MAG: hypothetical protein GF307_06760 [candidate division Zixibacteria bacterium]|nr:hypothetical protein [candidate division Zixibacteria bacterium]